MTIGMDLGFFSRAHRKTAERSSAGLDYGMFTAALQAFQSSTVTARIQAYPPGTEGLPELPQKDLVELLLGGPQWRDAVNRQGGSFNPAFARHRSGNV